VFPLITFTMKSEDLLVQDVTPGTCFFLQDTGYSKYEKAKRDLALKNSKMSFQK
jgi:hypothetical protein